MGRKKRFKRKKDQAKRKKKEGPANYRIRMTFDGQEDRYYNEFVSWDTVPISQATYMSKAAARKLANRFRGLGWYRHATPEHK